MIMYSFKLAIIVVIIGVHKYLIINHVLLLAHVASIFRKRVTIVMCKKTEVLTFQSKFLN